MNKSLSNVLMAAALAVPAFALTAVHAAEVTSGPKIGGDVYAFEPTHVTGPDKGTVTCPVCKYGSEPAAQVWVNGDDPANLAKITAALEGAIDKNGLKKFRAFVVTIPGKNESETAIKAKLNAFATANNLQNVALTYVYGPSKDAIDDYKINTDPAVKNTVIVYADRTVVANFVNLKGDADGLGKLQNAIATALTKGR